MLNLLLAFCLFMSNLSFSSAPNAQMTNTGLPVTAGSVSAPNSPIGDLLVAVNDLSYSNNEEEDDNWNESTENEELKSSSNDYVGELNSIENDLTAYNDGPVGCGPRMRHCAPKPVKRCCSPKVRRCEPKVRHCAPRVRHCEPKPVKRCCSPKVRRCEPRVRQCAPTVHRCHAPVGCAPQVRRCAPTVRRCAPKAHRCARRVSRCHAPVGCGPNVRRCAPPMDDRDDELDVDLDRPYGNDVRGEEFERRPMPRPEFERQAPAPQEMPAEESYASPRGSTISSQQPVRGLW